jgi:hypothetical protein
VRAPMTSRRIRGAHPQAGQVTGPTWGLGMGAGAGWTAGARGRSAMSGRGDAGAGWETNSGGGMRCEITRGSSVPTCCPSGRPDASPLKLF